MTKTWEKSEQEKVPEDLQEDPKLYDFVSQMYCENILERQSYGKKPYNSVFDYYRKHPDWLKEKFYGES
jgi:hypothetical protein